ncbi:MAG: filamentous hemagglutinin N-terminal domain-containing protein [Leptolyngbya sp. Prado105]|jgi:filamentous hemagglutinin family protein|nr:filamentous hemagglutinin N-terminal domain-containing protein [Leptolyngbya sp. Prado105]
MNKPTYRFWFAALVSLFLLTEATCSQAQISSDETVPTEVTSSNGRDFEINGGRQIGGNLFHSFGNFSIITGGSATFNNSLDVQNIISRVTGNSISSIDGLISARGNANFFLINPNGIILGANARLDIGGSVLFSTADRLNFADGSSFSATNTEAQPLLTISTPIGLQFGNNPGKIISTAQSEAPQVRPDKTLALVGGDIVLDGAYLLGEGGRLEIGSVASNSFVGLTAISKGWRLNYDAVRAFQDIQLSEAAIGGVDIDDIQLRGRRIAINNSIISTLTSGASPGGNLVVKASDSVTISNDSTLSTTTGAISISSTQPGGDIVVETPRLFVNSKSFISATTQGLGQGGNIYANAPESLEIDGQGDLTQLTTQTFGSGNAGDINVTTKRMVVREGGQITASAVAFPEVAVSGNAGRINIIASDSVEVSGQGVSEDTPFPSSLVARTRGSSTTGNGGGIQVDTGRLSLQNGGAISVAAERGSTGQAGSLTINAASVVVSGSNSTISAASTSPKPAGDVIINTNQLLVGNGAAINVNSQGTGSAGNLFVSVRSIELNDRGQIAATSNFGNGGNIDLQASNTLLLRNNSQISTTAGDAQAGGNGGNITFNGNFIVAVPRENSNISANAFSGRGGNIRITTQGIFGIEPRFRETSLSDITASSQFGISGTIVLNTPDVDPSRGLVQLATELQDTSGLIASGCPADEGNSFSITGNGGLPEDPRQPLMGNGVWLDDRAPGQARSITPDAIPQIVEAQGWIKHQDGSISLVATYPSSMTQAVRPIFCSVPSSP